MIRNTCVSGLFYASSEDLLRENIKNFYDSISKDNKYTEIVAGITPHAGYVYSGKTACYTFKQLEDNIPETFVILGPNHTGFGTNVDACDYDKWETPLGLIDVDNEFIDELLKVDENVCIDNTAHIKEHSIEVEIPFIQYICKEKPVKIVPLVISQQIPQLCEKLASSIKTVSEKLNRKIVLIASTDLTHYEDSETAKYYDTKVMNSVNDMDTNQLVKDIIDYDITMCGYGPTICAIEYAKLSNANNSNVLKYSNSGDVSGDYDSVVGYMSAIISK